MEERKSVPKVRSCKITTARCSRRSGAQARREEWGKRGRGGGRGALLGSIQTSRFSQAVTIYSRTRCAKKRGRKTACRVRLSRFEGSAWRTPGGGIAPHVLGGCGEKERKVRRPPPFGIGRCEYDFEFTGESARHPVSPGGREGKPGRRRETRTSPGARTRPSVLLLLLAA